MLKWRSDFWTISSICQPEEVRHIYWYWKKEIKYKNCKVPLKIILISLKGARINSKFKTINLIFRESWYKAVESKVSKDLLRLVFNRNYGNLPLLNKCLFVCWILWHIKTSMVLSCLILQLLRQNREKLFLKDNHKV